ncbi:MAG: hypothetical protein COU06_01570 [Candidatus Harrisonbacteria bacterium CG10_big_fil_rev_8_21_14_0_10_38_8]|uniref:Low affinity iron permease family protein n=1 Tax=Candidatus Harrisonbacteria bacterium CG10_big_fil_rev_8_21_14_0_10_38_8 TaxID=1974582 RepID=A0A2M6WK43_9BACT|nr:MAG: hypothetical protein COU06_01570 [Candidatus Harrisonbacteria bacterium CG10_big_fil_rev_8_21_14_0_10_38_8]
MNDIFRKIARRVGEFAGTPIAFITAIVLVVLWSMSGAYFGYSDTWQLFINTATTIMTFLMVFLIQNMQNRDGKAIQLKLDELIRSVKGARNKMVDIEDLSEKDLNLIDQEFRLVKDKADKRGTRAQKKS